MNQSAASSMFGHVRRTRPGQPIGTTLGFTLVELLIVVAIIGLLIAILLPAIQSARESARRTACRNNLRQLGLAAINHANVHGHFPTGGWGHGWTGDPDRGFAKKQPGGWIYNLLPFIETGSLRDLGADLPPVEKRAAAAVVISTPLAIMNCPTRRAPIPYPNTRPRQDYNTDTPPFVARADFAANCGDGGGNQVNDAGGPSTLEWGDTDYPWPNPALYTGIVFVRSRIRPAEVIDGTGKTYLFGEKYLNPEVYETGDDPSDWGHMYIGHGAETLRLAKKDIAPLRDYLGVSTHKPFGSAHADAFQTVLCDGSVHAIRYEIDRVIHGRLGNRRDNEIVASLD